MRAIPDNRAGVIDLATRALAGAERLGESIDLFHNNAERIAVDLFELIGPPDSSMDLGKQSELNNRRAVLAAARTVRREAVALARTFCANAIDSLKPHLGRRWNSNWLNAGFSRFTLAVPKYDPVPLVLELRGFLRAHPDKEQTAIGMTAGQADALVTQLQTAMHTVDTHRSARKTAATGRDSALRKLRRRLTALRQELDLLLDKDDNRWLEFGFSRPSDRRTPEPVRDLKVSPALPGQLQVRWSPSPRAINYRVSRQIVGVDAAPMEIGLFSDPATTIEDLPEGSMVTVSVSARNEAGERRAARVIVRSNHTAATIVDLALGQQPVAPNSIP
jgi:hypothetical protein